jgi:RimJ/RimL family protein N-acetyltransferase
MQIRQLTPEDAEAYFEHRRRALASEPLSFLSSPEDDRASSVAVVHELLDRGPDSVIYGAFEEGLVGSVGIFREPKMKAAHRGHIWGLYVVPERRRQGVARELLDTAVDHARTQLGMAQINLGVTDVAPAALALYESAGFRRWGTEPAYLRVDGRSVDAHHLVLTLERDGDG